MIAIFPNFYQKNRTLKVQINNNIVVMEKFYTLMSEKNQEYVCELKEMQTYLKLRSFLLSFREGKILSATKFILLAMLSPLAWRLLARIGSLNQLNNQESPIDKIILIDL